MQIILIDSSVCEETAQLAIDGALVDTTTRDKVSRYIITRILSVLQLNKCLIPKKGLFLLSNTHEWGSRYSQKYSVNGAGGSVFRFKFSVGECTFDLGRLCLDNHTGWQIMSMATWSKTQQTSKRIEEEEKFNVSAWDGIYMQCYPSLSSRFQLSLFRPPLQIIAQ